MLNPNLLAFTGEKDALIFFDAAAGDTVALRVSAPIEARFTDDHGREIARGLSCTFEKAGVYRALLAGDGGGRRTVEIEHGAGTLPFLMPGTGIVWDHGQLYPLLLAGERAHTVYMMNNPAFGRAVCCVKGAPNDERVRLSDESGALAMDWYPKLGRQWFWESAQVRSRDTWLRLDLQTGGRDTRVTLTHSGAALLSRPDRPTRTGVVTLEAMDEAGGRIDARFEMWIGDERVYMEDVLRDETARAVLPEGAYRLRVTRGVRCAPFETEVCVTDGGETAVRARLHERLVLPRGWALGELHCHSSFEDATLFPTETMRAARANGLNFCFQTDKDVEKLLEYGVNMCDLPGEFVGIPGQEIMCHELHMNVLGVDRTIDNPEADDLNAVNHDIEAKIARWLDEIHAMQARRVTTFMLNHPWHRPETMRRGQPYFRSWWVADVFREFHIVENFDYERWFDRLNRGRRLFGAWTGDGHDSAAMYPGREGVCVYVGDALSEESVIRAVDAGRFVSLRYPGVFVDLTAGGARVGETAKSAETATVTLSGCGTVDALELIADGKVVETRGNFALETGEMRRETFAIPESAAWILARVRMKDTGWDERLYSFTPLMCAGCDAFTNPIFLATENC